MFKIYVFIDSQNLHKSIEEQGWKIDYSKLITFLKDKYKVAKIFLFIGYVAGNEDLYKTLQDYGYTIIFKPILEYKNKQKKGNCDAELVLHCMIEYSNFHQAIIISGDGDFHCLLKYLKENNKLFKLGIPNKESYSALLRKFSEHFFFVSQLRKKLEYTKKKEA